MTTCPACGTDNREWASHCGECGRPLPEETQQRSLPTDTPRTDRLPAWLRQDVEQDQDQDQDQSVIPPPLRTGSARGASQLPSIPDGGLAGSLPAWLNRRGTDVPLAPALLSPPTRAPAAPRDIPDVTTFLSPEDLPAWLRRLADAEPPAASHPTSAPASPRPSIAPGPPAVRQTPDQPSVIALPPAAVPSTPPPPIHLALPATNHRLTALILGGLALALLVIAYALYLGATG